MKMETLDKTALMNMKTLLIKYLDNKYKYKTFCHFEGLDFAAVYTDWKIDNDY